MAELPRDNRNLRTSELSEEVPKADGTAAEVPDADGDWGWAIRISGTCPITKNKANGEM